MSLIEFIGFIITMAAFFILIVKQAFDKRKNRNQPEDEEEVPQEQEALLRELQQALDMAPRDRIVRRKEKKPPPTPKKKIKETHPEPQAAWLQRIQKEREERMELPALEKQSKVREMLRDPYLLKDAFILRELLGPPKGLE